MNTLRKDAEKMRRNGYSYNMISAKLGIAKSSLSNWLSEIPFTPNEELIKRIGNGKLKSALYKNKEKISDIKNRKEEARREVGVLSQRDLLMLGIGLYLGEGSKAFEEVRVTNANPVIIKLAINWIRKCCGVELENLRASIHAYPDSNISEAIDYWSKQTGMKTSQFTKTVIDSRLNKSAQKHQTLPYGTVHIYVVRAKSLLIRPTSIHRKIMGWIQAVTQQS